MQLWERYKKIMSAFILGLLTGVVISSFFLTTRDYSAAAGNKDFKSEVSAVLAACEQEEYRPACYDIELPKLMDEGYSMEEVFVITKGVQQADTSYQYCHILGHYLSQKETAKDPMLWKDVITRAPSGVCSNGAIHGAFQERFRAEALPDASVAELQLELEGICEPREGWNPTRMEEATCTHALGHLTMYVTDGNISRSLDLCDALVESDERNTRRQLCYDGAFMQIFQPLEPEDIKLVEHFDVDTKEKARAFCRQFDEVEQFGSCNSESWPLFIDELRDPERIGGICQPVVGTGWQYERCMDGMFYVLVAQLNLDSERIFGYCGGVPSELAGRCYGSAASRMIEVDWKNIDKALNVCHAGNDEEVRELCYNELLKYSGYTFKPGSEEFINLCQGLPLKQGKQCFDRM